MPTLLALLQSLDELPAGDDLRSPALDGRLRRGGAAFDAPPPNLAYLLEVELAKDVVEVWSSWRNGARPNATQKCQAVIHYAYLDVHTTEHRHTVKKASPVVDKEQAG